MVIFTLSSTLFSGKCCSRVNPHRPESSLVESINIAQIIILVLFAVSESLLFSFSGIRVDSVVKAEQKISEVITETCYVKGTNKNV